MLTQLNPPIPMFVKDKGTGHAFAVIDYGQEHHLMWVIGFDSGEIWTVQNPQVRLQHNWTMNRC